MKNLRENNQIPIANGKLRLLNLDLVNTLSCFWHSMHNSSDCRFARLEIGIAIVIPSLTFFFL